MNKDIAALILRLGFGFYMLLGHGIPKIPRLFEDEIRFASVFGMPPAMSLALVVFAEVICAIAIIIGFKTKWAVIPLIFTMLVAAFYIHLNDPWFAVNAAGGSNKEMAMLFLFGYLGVYFLGSGKYAVDRVTRF